MKKESLSCYIETPQGLPLRLSLASYRSFVNMSHITDPEKRGDPELASLLEGNQLHLALLFSTWSSFCKFEVY
jgi:hypothetical protein